jgi:hypothetical protein
VPTPTPSPVENALVAGMGFYFSGILIGAVLLGITGAVVGSGTLTTFITFMTLAVLLLFVIGGIIAFKLSPALRTASIFFSIVCIVIFTVIGTLGHLAENMLVICWGYVVASIAFITYALISNGELIINGFLTIKKTREKVSQDQESSVPVSDADIEVETKRDSRSSFELRNIKGELTLRSKQSTRTPRYCPSCGQQLPAEYGILLHGEPSKPCPYCGR